VALKNVQGGIAMQNSNISKTVFIVILLIFLLNAIISTANVIEDGAILRRVIPAVCWTLAAIIWIASYLRKSQR
jgi:fumarate reductase subunit D